LPARRSSDLADAAYHRRDERFPADQDAHVGIDDRVRLSKQDTPGRRQPGPDGEGEGDDPVDGNAHQGDHRPIPGNGPHGHAREGPADEPVQGQHQPYGHADDEQLHRGNGETPGQVEPLRGDERREGPRLGADGAQDEVFEKNPYPKRRDDRDTRGALRSGLYARRSMVTPRSAVHAIVNSSVGTIGSLSQTAPARPMKAPTMKMSPWAKLIRRRIP